MNKNIAIFVDGTWEEPETTVSHVLRACRAVSESRDLKKTQVILYHQGVGTGNGIDKITGGIWGLGVNKSIRQVYRMLSHNYTPGDKVFLFGFSRGAFCVRSLANWIYDKGLLRPEHLSKTRKSFKAYLNRKPLDDFEQYTYDRAIDISYIGVWDTVGGHGVPTPLGRFKQRFFPCKHKVGLNVYIESARHAVAMNETRRSFMPDLWEENEYTDLKRQWFAGTHGDLGGVSEKFQNGTTCYYIPLIWIIAGAKKRGLVFNDSMLEKYDNCSEYPYVTISSKGKSVIDKIMQLPGEYKRSPTFENFESVHYSSLELQKPSDMLRWSKNIT